MDRERIERTSEQAWLQQRAKDVTSTEVSALFGLSPYMTEFELWHRKANAEIVRILHLPEVKERLAADGSEPVGNTPQEFGAHIAAEIAKWRKVVQAAGIRVD